jgi:queuine tRNA-ribosyltransferase
LRHLFAAQELLAYRLNSIHNLTFYLDLMAGLRAAIERGEAQAYVERALEGFAAGE